MYCAAALLFSLATVAYAQQAGTQTPESHPALPIKSCTTTNGVSSCQALKTKIVLDANWRWTHYADTANIDKNCYSTSSDASAWDQSSVCALNGDGQACAVACAVDGIDYVNDVGVTADGKDAVTLDFVTTYTSNGVSGTNVGSRLFLMDEKDENYKGFNLLNREFTFTVDASNLPCGVNGALYFVQMELDGGLSESPVHNGVKTNTAGPQFGTGYCDSTCAQGLKFIGGEANSPGWTSSTASGATGTCCTEMDIWEANQISTAFTAHPCSGSLQASCTGDQCGPSGLCDKDGCDFNSFRMGNETFYGPSTSTQSYNIDSTKPVTVVTRFITNDGTDTGTLSQIQRKYFQGGKFIGNSNSDIASVPNQSWSDGAWCTAQKTAFGDTNTFSNLGGFSKMSSSMKSEHVLVLSIWDDSLTSMNWLDSRDPASATAPYAPGVERGTCDPAAGDPGTVEKAFPAASVKFSDIRYGPIGSTNPGGP